MRITAGQQNTTKYYYENVFKTFIKQNTKYRQFFESHQKDLNASVVLKLLAIKHLSNKQYNQDYWYNLGYRTGSIFCLSFAQFINEQSVQQNTTHVAFIARDGFALRKVFNVIKSNPQTNTSYVYSPRLMSIIIRQDYENYGMAYLTQIISYYKPILNKSDQNLDVESAKRILMEKGHLLKPIAEKMREEFTL